MAVSREKYNILLPLVVTKLIFPVSLVFCYPPSSFKKFKLMLRDRLFTTQSSILPGFENSLNSYCTGGKINCMMLMGNCIPVSSLYILTIEIMCDIFWMRTAPEDSSSGKQSGEL